MKAARLFTSRPQAASPKRTNTDVPHTRITGYPASMFAVHEVIPRKLSLPELEHQQHVSALFRHLSPREQEKLEARLAHVYRPIGTTYRAYTFRTAKQRKVEAGT